MRLIQLAQVGARVRFLAVGMVALALGGCAPTYSVKKIDEAVDPSDRFVAFEAEVPRNFVELGDCLVEEKQRTSFSPDYYLYGAIQTVKLYNVEISDEWLGKATKFIRLHRINQDRTKLFVTPVYNPLAKSFSETAGLDQLITKCSGGPLENVREFDDNRKRYENNFDRISREVFEAGIEAVKLPDYELKRLAYLDELKKLLRTRTLAEDKLFIESALAGELKPFNAYFTKKYYHLDFRGNNVVFSRRRLLAQPLKKYLKEADPKVFSLFCAGYAVSQSVFLSHDETDERIVVMVRGRMILDGAIVPKEHPFYQACLQGTEIGS